ncbi:prepilin-type N-terminal cleavage/methylation domain-containing protein [Cerasicoccus arenae]|uniref:Prepilin-type N-terminal cleavage/methylation domain-containing protein n=1 Tax=Cerasicoccus arenae TaxID=424488 RepID=A0A8J3DKE6_9BACT|nr:prepilin-type N-terminal cleavage/methylation domain-containing protein [Cerasicoccus arenae]MBK1858384.1 prepilin-type N-terminal cleavage/methylation domain-containing protein [Cerasicoccus arenae]GHC09934.1 hypothetical protein GCM10007047_29130 [Cerasicoccus arenae]
MHLSSKHRSRGFSLLELLVAIAVIAILSGLLMVTLGRTRTAADNVKCVNNLRQLGGALRMYANENKGFLPKPTDNYLNKNATSVSWMIVTGDYMNMPFPKTNQDTFFLCPEAMNTYPDGNARRTYAMNAAGTDSKTAMNLLVFENPVSTALLYDSASSSSIDGYAVFGINSFEKNVEWRHNHGTNVLMIDGHVEHVSEDDIDQLELYVRNFIY